MLNHKIGCGKYYLYKAAIQKLHYALKMNQLNYLPTVDHIQNKTTCTFQEFHKTVQQPSTKTMKGKTNQKVLHNIEIETIKT